MHWIDSVISFFHLSVCEQTGCRAITSTILDQFSRNFACGSEMWSLRCLLVVRQSGCSLPIFEVCRFRFWQFSGSGDHIFQQISTKSHIHIKFSNAEFAFNGEWKQKSKSDFRDVQIPDLVSISALWTNYFHNSLRILPNFTCGSEM